MHSKHSKLYTFSGEEQWETIDTYWRGPFSYWARCGVRVTPPVPLRVKVMGAVLEESDEGWINVGGVSSLLRQRVQARGRRGDTVRIEIGEEITEQPLQGSPRDGETVPDSPGDDPDER